MSRIILKHVALVASLVTAAYLASAGQTEFALGILASAFSSAPSVTK